MEQVKSEMAEEKIATFTIKSVVPPVSRARLKTLFIDPLEMVCVAIYQYGIEVDGVFVATTGTPDVHVKYDMTQDQSAMDALDAYLDIVHTYSKAMV